MQCLMKCMNMEIVDVLFLLANVMVINSSAVRQNKPTLTKFVAKDEVSKSRFSQNCSHLLEMIRDNKLSDYMSNCKVINEKYNIQSKENVLQHACFVLQNMLNVVCSKSVNETSLNLLAPDVTNKICPFNFAHLEPLDVYKNHEVIKKLEEEDFCKKVCYDLYSPEVQCVLLGKFNNYLKSQMGNEEADEEVEKPIVKPHFNNIDRQKAAKTVIEQPVQQNQLDHFNKPQLSQSNQHHPTQENKPQVIESDQPLAIKSNQPKSIKTNQPQSIKPLSENEAKEMTATLNDGNPNRVSTEPLDSPLKKKNKIEKTVAIPTSRDEIKLIDNLDVPQVNTKVQSADSYEENLKSKEKLQEEDLPNEGNSLQMGDDMDPSRVNPNQDLEFSKVQSPPEKENPFVNKKETFIGEGFSQAEDSHFFFYFIMVSSVVVVGYLAFHNKNKILAYALEGSSGRRSRRRPNPARYRKLETNLEEAMTSSASNAATSSVVY